MARFFIFHQRFPLIDVEFFISEGILFLSEQMERIPYCNQCVFSDKEKSPRVAPWVL